MDTRRFVLALHAASAVDDVDQLLDALWLSRHLRPAVAPPAAAGDELGDDAPPNATQPRQTPADPMPLPTDTAPPSADVLRRIDIPLDPDDPNAAAGARRADSHRLFGLGDPGSGDGLRARRVQVAGVTALRDAPALARALRPLGRWRRTPGFAQLDEDRTVEEFAQTNVLVPRFLPQRTRWFDALLLVEETSASPLWRSTVDELEALLSRQVGFRSTRRCALQAGADGLQARSRSGTLAQPARLIAGDATIVFVVSDCTSPAWADGRMSALMARLGRTASPAVMQLLPPRLWPNTLLGSADWRVAAPHIGAHGAELRVDAPDWLAVLGDDPAATGTAVPVLSLQPAALRRWSRMMLGRAGAHTEAGMLWDAPLPDIPDANAAPDDAVAAAPPPDAQQRVARLRSVANARVLQTAIHLSAAAPLSLAIVRLVQRVMQPHGSSEDLPLLLLSGVLVPQAPVGGRKGDEFVAFDFADGVRALLQRSLVRHEVERVRHAVSAWIAERAGLPRSFAALLEDPDGDVPLPPWAQPFADVTRQLDRLFDPGAQRPAKTRTVQERELAAGVTVRARLDGFEAASALACSPDGTRLAVRHAAGIETYAVAHADAPLLEPIALADPVAVLIVKGRDVDERRLEDFIAGLRAGMSARLRGRCDFRYHTPLPDDARQSRLREETQRLADLVRQTDSLVCTVGGQGSLGSKWMGELHVALGHAKIEPSRVFQAVTDPDWQLADLRDQRWPLPANEAAAGAAAARVIARRVGALLQAATFGAQTRGLAWSNEGRLLALHIRRNALVREGQGREVEPLARVPGQTRLLQLRVAPTTGQVAVIGDGQVVLDALAAAPRVLAGPGVPGFEFSPRSGSHAMAWGDTLTVFGPDGAIGSPTTLPPGLSPTSPGDSAAPAALIAWEAGGRWLAFAHGRELVRIDADPARPPRRLRGVREPAGNAHRSLDAAVLALAWSPSGDILACATADGGIRLLGVDLQDHVSLAFGWGPDPSANPTAVALAFAPRPIDGRYDELCVARGDRVWWLRIDPVLVRRGSPAPRAAIEPTIAPVQAPPSNGLPGALALLQAMAMAFHVGQLVPVDDAQRSSPRRLLDRLQGEPHNALNHLIYVTETLFDSPVKQVLIGGEDPIRVHDAVQARARYDAQREALAEHAKAGSGAAPGRWLVRWLAVATELLADHDPAAFERIDGPLLTDYLAAVDRPDPAPSTGLPTLEAVVATLTREDVATALAPYCSLFFDRFATDGPSYLMRCGSYDRYLSELLDLWKSTSEQMFKAQPEGLARAVEISYPTPRRHLERFPPGVAPPLLQIGKVVGRVDPDTQDEPGHAWSLPRAEYLRLIDELGAMVLAAVRRRLAEPPRRAAVLWVDDRGEENRVFRDQVLYGKADFTLAASTDEALALLRVRAFDVVITDTSRQPDSDAAPTLLREMRRHGFLQPVVVYSTRKNRSFEPQALALGLRGIARDRRQLDTLLFEALNDAPPGPNATR